MYKKVILSLVLLLFCLNIGAQNNPKKIDLRFGMGASLLGTGDVTVGMYEAELNRKFSSYFAVGTSLAFGRSSSGEYNHASFEQGNINFFISPFRNNRRNDFRIGTGMSYYDVSETHWTAQYYTDGIISDVVTDTKKRNSFGFNLILENTHMVNERFFLGIKVFTQPYRNGDINSGILLKAGVNLY